MLPNIVRQPATQGHVQPSALGGRVHQGWSDQNQTQQARERQFQSLSAAAAARAIAIGAATTVQRAPRPIVRTAANHPTIVPTSRSGEIPASPGAIPGDIAMHNRVNPPPTPNLQVAQFGLGDIFGAVAGAIPGIGGVLGPIVGGIFNGGSGQTPTSANPPTPGFAPGVCVNLRRIS